MQHPIHVPRSLIVSCLLGTGLLLQAEQTGLRSSSKESETIATDMAKQAEKLIASFDAGQRAKAVFTLDDKVREAWHFFPNRPSRAGLPLNALNPGQRAGVMELLQQLLTSQGFDEQEKLRIIHGLKQDMAAPDNPRHLYFIAFFGQPSPRKTWAWRYEGHHLSLNVTLGGGQHFSVTPSFWGAGPVKVTQGARKGERVFAAELDIAQELARSFTPEQRVLAAPEGLRGGPGTSPALVRGAYENQRGIPFQQLDPAQQVLLQKLVLAYAGKYRPGILREINRRKSILDTASMSFACSGEFDGTLNRYKIFTRDYLIEMSTGNGNHVHSAWRDFDGDFGRDLIAEHLEAAH